MFYIAILICLVQGSLFYITILICSVHGTIFYTTKSCADYRAHCSTFQYAYVEYNKHLFITQVQGTLYIIKNNNLMQSTGHTHTHTLPVSLKSVITSFTSTTMRLPGRSKCLP